jgi:hypothetical protein
MACRRCGRNRLCNEHAQAALAAQRRRELEAKLETQEPLPVSTPEEPEPVGPGVDAGYDYNIGAYRRGYQPPYPYQETR